MPHLPAATIWALVGCAVVGYFAVTSGDTYTGGASDGRFDEWGRDVASAVLPGAASAALGRLVRWRLFDL